MPDVDNRSDSQPTPTDIPSYYTQRRSPVPEQMRMYTTMDILMYGASKSSSILLLYVGTVDVPSSTLKKFQLKLFLQRNFLEAFSALTPTV
jgi:hypothetical protein